jgi:hypothetical protein
VWESADSSTVTSVFLFSLSFSLWSFFFSKKNGLASCEDGNLGFLNTRGENKEQNEVISRGTYFMM